MTTQEKAMTVTVAIITTLADTHYFHRVPQGIIYAAVQDSITLSQFTDITWKLKEIGYVTLGNDTITITAEGLEIAEKITQALAEAGAR